MIATNYSEFRKDMKSYLDRVEENDEILILKRKSGKGTVILSMDEYNSMLETMHLLKSGANAEHLLNSIEQLKKGKVRSVEVDQL